MVHGRDRRQSPSELEERTTNCFTEFCVCRLGRLRSGQLLHTGTCVLERDIHIKGRWYNANYGELVTQMHRESSRSLHKFPYGCDATVFYRNEKRTEGAQCDIVNVSIGRLWVKEGLEG